jgi:manganese-dependent inorganic pyrophosphatase
MFRAEPVGSTATIVTKCYKENGIEIPQDIAGILLGAIISDTLLFKSPTCTPTDTKLAKELAKIAEVDLVEFGMEMFKAGTSLVGKTVEEIFNQDYKTFNFGDLKVGIAQVNTMDFDGFMPYKEEMLEYMESFTKDNHMEFSLLLLTDVINANSVIFVAGPRPDYVSKAFNCELVDHQATLPGVISRKKQVVPAVTNAITG